MGLCSLECLVFLEWVVVAISHGTVVVTSTEAEGTAERMEMKSN